MKIAPTATIIGYDVDSGKELFTHPNVLIRNYEGIHTLPGSGQIYKSRLNTYRVIGVRQDSTEALCKIDVRPEAS